MMKTVIGLVWYDQPVERVMNRLKEAGFPENKVSVLTNKPEVRECLGGRYIVAKDTGIGAALGIATFGPFGVMAGINGLTLFGYGPAFVAGTIGAGILIGAAFGAFMAYFIGLAAMENITHLYTKGVQLGGSVMVVQTNDEHASEAKAILQQENVLEVKFLHASH